MKLSKPRLRREFFFSIAAEKGRCISYPLFRLCNVTTSLRVGGAGIFSILMHFPFLRLIDIALQQLAQDYHFT